MSKKHPRPDLLASAPVYVPIKTRVKKVRRKDFATEEEFKAALRKGHRDRVNARPKHYINTKGILVTRANVPVTSDGKMNTKRRKKLTPAKYLKALPGTGGTFLRIAAKMKLGRQRVADVINKPEKFPGKRWERVRQAWRDERENTVDRAEMTVQKLMSQNKDLRVAANLAKWFLSQKRPDEYGKKKEDQNQTVNGNLIQIGNINLPLEQRKQLLEAIERGEVPQVTSATPLPVADKRMIETTATPRPRKGKKLKNKLTKRRVESDADEAE